MYAALVLCSALLSADADSVTIRVVNTLEEPVTVSFRIAGKPDWLKDELALDVAQTKNFALPRGDKYDVLILDAKKENIPAGTWDFGKLLTKDAKAEIHICNTKQNLGNRDRKATTVTPTPSPYVPNVSPYPLPRAELNVFSQKKYAAIDEFIDGKKADQSPTDKSKPDKAAVPPLAPGGTGVPIPLVPRRIDRLERFDKD